MAIASNFPAIKPSLSLDFANTKKLDSRITFTRTTTATYYDGVTTAKAEENLLLQSQAFNNASWINQNTTETDNAATAPDGTSTAATLNDGAATGAHDIGENFSGTSGVTYTLSAFFKDVDRQYVILACSASTSSWASAKFDLTAGTAGSTSASGSGWSTTSSSITSVGNSWYRCTITFVSGTTGTLTARLGMATDGTTFTAGQRGLESYTGTNATIEIWGAQLEQRSSVSSYTATTTQAITNYIPVLLTAASGVARFDHNPTTDESLGLLIEEARTNLLTYSADFSNAAWTKTASTITANTVVSPDGALTGDKLIVDDGVAFGSGFTRQNVSKAASAITYTSTIYAKAGEFNRVRCLCRDSTTSANSASVTISLVDGSVVVAAAATGTFTSASSSTTSVGNGWYRISLTFTSGTETTIWGGTYIPSDSVATQGNGYSGIYIWGAQLEAGAFPTSYIATTSATVTRNADAATMTGSNFTSWYNQGEGTLYAEFSAPNTEANTRIVVGVNDGTTSEWIVIAKASNNRSTSEVYDGGAAQVLLSSAAGNLVSTSGKVSFAYKVNDFAASTNSLLDGTDTSGTLPTVSQMNIGDRATGSRQLNGTIKKIAYYPLRLTNAQLQALTS